MFEKVNPSHPDKIADRIAGALVDLAYKKQENPRIAVEVLLGHGRCFVIAETSVHFEVWEVDTIVQRIQQKVKLVYIETKQDENLAKNQEDIIKCGDNGIFKGCPVTDEQKELTRKARLLYSVFPTDGKYLVSKDRLIICQSNAGREEITKLVGEAEINPLGFWTGGTDVDCGTTNRKLGSDMADGVTGGGLHGKDLSKGDVSLNIYAFLKAQQLQRNVEISCAIGDSTIDGKPYSEIVEQARTYIHSLGGFEKFAEWGLVR